MAEDNKLVSTTTNVSLSDTTIINHLISISRERENEVEDEESEPVLKELSDADRESIHSTIRDYKYAREMKNTFDVLAEMNIKDMTPLQAQILHSICQEFPEFVEEVIDKMMKEMEEFVTKTQSKSMWEKFVVRGVVAIEPIVG